MRKGIIKEDKDEKVLKEKANVALRWKALDHETIKYINFLDDERPQFVFVILESSKTNNQYIKLIKIQTAEEGSKQSN